MKTIRVAGYERVSTEEQTLGLSPETQRARIDAQCQAKTGPEERWLVVGHYYDAGKSGRKIHDRTEYLRMMGRDFDMWDALVVADLSRVHRNVRNFMDMMDKLNAAGKQFVSITENFDTSTTMGRFAMDVIARVRQLESEVISDRARAGHKASKARGYRTLRRLPKWFVVKEVDGKRFVEPSEETYEILKRMATEGPTAVALSLRISSTKQLYATQRLVNEWTKTGPWLLPNKRLNSVGA